MEIKPGVTPDTLARLEMAKEKARIMEKKFVTAVSELERAAEKWKENKDEEIIWRQRRLYPEKRPRQVKMNAAMISSIARHLRAREWARAMGKARKQPNDGYELEKAAEQWERQKNLSGEAF